MRRLRDGTSPLRAGVLTLVVIVLFSYFGFSRANPFRQQFELRAVFADAKNIGARSPVRIAGVEVGKVVRVEPAGRGASASVVVMKLERNALPIHRDATLKIRPRIFLEGNFFVDLNPGTPGTPTLRDGATIPLAQTASTVQLGQVLDSLRADTRKRLQELVQGYGGAVGGSPTPGEDADQDPEVQGLTAGEALNRSLVDAPEALRGTAVVNDALQGLEARDLSRLVAAQQRVSAALVSREEQLKDLISNFNTTVAAFAAEQDNVARTVQNLPGALRSARQALASLDRSFPATRAFAREILPGVRETPATIDAAFPWIREVRALLSTAELRGLVADLRPATRNLATLTGGTIRLLPQADLVNRCALDVLLPTGDVVIQDGPLTTGLKNYQEFFQSMVGLAGESQNFDGNGFYTRFQTGGGSVRVRTETLPGGAMLGNFPLQPLGTRPVRPAQRPPVNTTFPCYRNQRPDLNSARTGAGP
ncbi:MCE family protein [Thermoleophilum album]|uniref:MlaD family protein n=1 Tax=Thermoleophilum album TaxID=29539 RepID=UPI00237C82E1|nr:MlaD family protein [Thermoleophilum album]WDT93357.1 MCE family protein [Thermoleophilum album]